LDVDPPEDKATVYGMNTYFELKAKKWQEEEDNKKKGVLSAKEISQRIAISLQEGEKRLQDESRLSVCYAISRWRVVGIWKRKKPLLA
jgi:hypothetical protein